MASGPITSWQIDGGEMGTVPDFIFSGSKITVDCDCSHEIKRRLLLGRKAMTNLDSILKSRDITLLKKVCIDKVHFFQGSLEKVYFVCIDKVHFFQASLVAQSVENPPAVRETWVRSLGWEDPLEEGMATHSSVLAWRSAHGQRSLAGYSPWGHKESDTTE